LHIHTYPNRYKGMAPHLHHLSHCIQVLIILSFNEEFGRVVVFGFQTRCQCSRTHPHVLHKLAYIYACIPYIMDSDIIQLFLSCSSLTCALAPPAHQKNKQGHPPHPPPPSPHSVGLSSIPHPTHGSRVQMQVISCNSNTPLPNMCSSGCNASCSAG
jgi:hypothetical protein